VGAETSSYRGFRYPVEIISHCVRLYHRFPLSFRQVEMMPQRGVQVGSGLPRDHPAMVRQVRATYANMLRHRRPPGDRRVGSWRDDSHWR
jgi:putative transposase